MDYGAGKVVEEGLIYLYIYIDEREIGEDFYYPMDLGTFGSEFTVSHTDNITEYISDYEPVPTTMTTIMTWCIASLYSLLFV